MTVRPLPESCSSLTPLASGPLLAIDDWHCAGHDSPGREDELCTGDAIVITRRGTYELTMSGVAHAVDPLVATFWNRGEYYRVRHPSAGDDQCTVLRLSEQASEALWRIARRSSSPSSPRARTRSSEPQTFAATARPIDGHAYLLHRGALGRARAARSQSPTSANALRAIATEESALELVRALCADDIAARPTSVVGAQARVVDSARELIASNFRGRLSLADIARHAGCSPFHLSRLFRRATGLTIHRAIVRLRLRDALERLLDEPAELSTIALDAGFASHSHFGDAFRAEYGCAPSEARAWRLR